MKQTVLFFCCILFSQLMTAQLPKPSTGSIKRLENFASKYVDTRNIDVWLPDDYTNQQQYAVLYMHDGQMLFDATINWNKQEWAIDETLGTLMNENKIRNCIVVGIWNSDQKRHLDYFPKSLLKLHQ